MDLVGEQSVSICVMLKTKRDMTLTYQKQMPTWSSPHLVSMLLFLREGQSP